MLAITLVPDEVEPISLDATQNRRRLRWALGVGVAGLVAAILWVAGVSAFPLVLVAGVAGGLGIAQFSNLRLGLLGALAVLLGGYAILLRFTMVLHWGLAAFGGLALLALVLFGMAALLRSEAPLLPSNRAAVIGAVLAVLALLATIVFIPVRSAQGVGPAWAMHNDAVIQMIKARVQIDAGGFDTSHALNSSPLTSALVALAATIGRQAVADPNRYLENDALRLAEFWGLLVLASSALSAWIVYRMATRHFRTTVTGTEQGEPWAAPQKRFFQLSSRPELVSVLPDDSRRPIDKLPILAALIGAALPFTWYYAGFAFAFGFLNSTLSLVILLLSWALWLELDEACPALTAALLSLATVAMLATWAPLALIPAGLTLLALWRALPFHSGSIGQEDSIGQDIETKATPRGQWLAWVLAALPVPLYGLFVTLPDFNRQGEDLAVEGGIVGVPFHHIVAVALIAAAGLVLYALVTRNLRMLAGLAALALASVAVLAVLIHLNTRVGLPGWGYYPFKAAWAITSLLIIIGLAAWFGAILRARWLSLAKVAAIALVTALTLVVMRQYLWEPVGIRNFFAPLEVLRSTGYASGPWRANILFDAYRHDELTILSIEDARWMAQDQIVPGDGRADQFSNFWLLQVHPGAGLPGGDEHLTRAFAYTLDPRSPEQICNAVTTWGQPTTVLTLDVTLEDQLRALCPAANFSVENFQPAWPAG